MDRVFNDIEHWLHDEHVARQTSFIAGLDLSKAVFFWCDQDLARNVEDFFINQGFVHTTPPPPINEQNRNSLTVDAANKWRQILSQPRYLDTFRKTFADDYKLINSVDFYKANTTKNAQ
jgi:hypothetical protein